MATQAAIPKNLLIFGIALPLALILGYVLTDPMSGDSLAVLGVTLSVLLIPLILRFHHPLLIVSLNSGISIFFLPGQPSAWMVFAGASLVVTALTCVLDKRQKFQQVLSITIPLILLAVVVVVTAQFTGGMGVAALGGNVQGGKKYYYLLFSILAYFAISGQPIPKEKAPLYMGLFLLSQMVLASSNLIYLAGEQFYFLYLFFPMEFAINQAMEDMQVDARFSRLSGIGFAGVGAVLFMQMRYGIRGLFDFSKPWRMVLWLVFIFISTLGGFRSVLVVFVLVFAFQYYFEKLWKTGITVILGLGLLGFFVFAVFFATKLPSTVQRAISFLPVDVDPIARADAQGSIDWRLKIWSYMIPEIPRYFWVGKGYATSPMDQFLALQAWKRGLGEDIEMTLIAGDYHSGPLSIQIPFGIWGTLVFLAFVAASIRLLYYNYRWGDPDLQRINVFILSAFIARVIYFIVFFGGISTDLTVLASYVGLSVAINRGMRRDPETESRAAVDRDELPALEEAARARALS